MTSSTRETILFWCQVGLYVSAMITLLGILLILGYAITTQINAMEVDRARDKVMLQQHQHSLHHGEQLLSESRQALQDHQRQMERLAR